MKWLWAWTDDPANRRRLGVVALGVLIALCLIDPLLGIHGYFAIEELPVFGGLMGLASVIGLAAVSWLFGAVLTRRRYDDE
ncbi:MAG: hypothetical protein AAGC57_08240 [Pseudomonadota bacterium]